MSCSIVFLPTLLVLLTINPKPEVFDCAPGELSTRELIDRSDDYFGFAIGAIWTLLAEAKIDTSGPNLRFSRFRFSC
jgi:hypothetical protein